jgi:hypothetical protein
MQPLDSSKRRRAKVGETTGPGFRVPDEALALSRGRRFAALCDSWYLSHGDQPEVGARPWAKFYRRSAASVAGRFPPLSNSLPHEPTVCLQGAGSGDAFERSAWR